MSQSELEFSYSDKKGTKIFASATTTLQMKMTTFVGFLLSRKVFVECSKYYSHIHIMFTLLSKICQYTSYHD